MRLKRLELQGFKSFLDRTILNFEPGITGVVGPNGCGKSNIVDAILWVMGEQSPKHLRGESMTDVIFNGSDTRAPTSMAEVSLVLDREGVQLAPEYSDFEASDEISITRRLYRDGTAEFLINKSECRLKDIHELFMDTGVGRRAYSIIEQGQIDRMINVKPEERRGLFEEVAGVTKYKLKRREAERRLEQTEANMLRLQDIILELEKQIRSLKIQSTRARKYKELKGELEAIDLFLMGRKLYQVRFGTADLEARIAALTLARSEAEAAEADVAAKTTQAEVRRLELESLSGDLSRQERDLMLAIQKLESGIQLQGERRSYLEETDRAAREEQQSLETKRVDLLEESQRLVDERASLETQLGKLIEELKDIEGNLRLAESERLEKVKLRERHQTQKNRLGEKLVVLESEREHLQSREAELRDRQNHLNEKLSQLIVSLEQCKAKLEASDKEVEDSKKRVEAGVQEVEGQSRIHKEISQELSALDEAFFSAREEFHSLKARLQSLTELQENLEGYAPTALETLKTLEADGIKAIPFAELLQPEPGLEDVLETLLGQDMNLLIVRHRADAERLTRSITGKELPRARVLSEEDAAVPFVFHAEPSVDPEGADRLLNHVTVKQGWKSVVQCRLRDIYLCETPEDVFRLRLLHPEMTFIARTDKTLSSSDHSLSAGALTLRTGIFSRRREIEDLGRRCNEKQEEISRLEVSRGEVQTKLENQEKARAASEEALSGLHLKSLEARKEREKTQLEWNRTDKDYSGTLNDSGANQKALDANAASQARVAQQEGDLKIELEEVTRSFEASLVGIQETEQHVESLRTLSQERRVEQSRLKEKKVSLEDRLNRTEAEVESALERIQDIESQFSENQAARQAIEQTIQESTVEREASVQRRGSVQSQLSEVQQQFEVVCQEISEWSLKRDSLRKDRDQCVTDLQEATLKHSEVLAESRHLQELAVERYNLELKALDDGAWIDVDTLPLFKETLDSNWESGTETERENRLTEHLEELRAKVSRYGEVNLTAIHEFDEVQKRFEFLEVQRQDLEKSIQILREAISKIDLSTRERFEQTFQAVDKKFREIFPILFSGGKAELLLTNPENLLESGVDILVQPPGKRLQSITLLSGGEKALTAVSLVLAIFARKPSPFCLLDEVDAPLDDANVSRFNTVVAKMAEKTQFIVITHNKKTMEIAEALYGVTMERAGISKMASVRLN